MTTKKEEKSPSEPVVKKAVKPFSTTPPPVVLEPGQEAPVKRGFHRPPGSPNKVSAATRALIQTLVEDNMEKMNAELEAMHGKDYIAAVVSLMEFALPRLQRTEHTDGTGSPLVITVRHSVEPPTLPANRPEIVEDIPFEAITPTTSGPAKPKRPF